MMVVSGGTTASRVESSRRMSIIRQSAPLVLPVAHDALTARLIELAGYPALEPIHKDRERRQMRVYSFAAERQNGNSG